MGSVSRDDYAEQVRNAVAFLNGKTADLLKDLEKQMFQAADDLDFETAAKLRDQIQALSVIQSKQFIDSQSVGNQADIDIVALAQANGGVCLHWVSIRGGRHVGDKSFFPDTRHDPNPNGQDYAEAFVAQHYLGKMKPDVLICNFRLPESLQAALNSEHSRAIQFPKAEKGERKVWLNMAIQNAEHALSQHQLQNVNQQARVAALAEIVGLPASDLRRLECFDISHTQGEATLASCVVYDNGETVRFPDAVLIDGGMGQIGVAVAVWEELGLTIPLVGIAKGVERKAGLEELILPFSGERFRLPPNSPALHLLQTVRDESHRFAITGMRAKRDKARVTSSLNDIAGVGAKRKAALLMRFGGLRGVQAASVDDLAQVDGISRALAEKIYEYLHH